MRSVTRFFLLVCELTIPIEMAFAQAPFIRFFPSTDIYPVNTATKAAISGRAVSHKENNSTQKLAERGGL